MVKFLGDTCPAAGNIGGVNAASWSSVISRNALISGAAKAMNRRIITAARRERMSARFTMIPCIVETLFFVKSGAVRVVVIRND